MINEPYLRNRKANNLKTQSNRQIKKWKDMSEYKQLICTLEDEKSQLSEKIKLKQQKQSCLLVLWNIMLKG